MDEGGGVEIAAENAAGVEEAVTTAAAPAATSDGTPAVETAVSAGAVVAGVSSSDKRPTLGDGDAVGSHRAPLDGFTGSLTSSRNLSVALSAASSSVRESTKGYEAGQEVVYPIITKPVSVSWWRQVKFLSTKNAKLLQRRTGLLLAAIFSSFFSVIFAGVAGKDSDKDVPPISPCGTVSYVYTAVIPSYEDRNVPVTLNEEWRDGVPVAVMALGPLISTGLCAFLMVNNEIHAKMLGVLRGQGVRDSAYWISWFVPFLFISVINSLLGGIAGQFMSVHVLRNVYFGGVFGSLFFLQLALLPCSFFFAAVCGTAHLALTVWMVLILLVAPWVIWGVYAASGSSGSFNPYDQEQYANVPTGFFWLNQNTTTTRITESNQTCEVNENGYNVCTSYATNWTFCDNPRMNEYWGKQSQLTHEQREEIGYDDYFLGCYAASGYPSYAYSGGMNGFALAVLWMFPYFHFYNAWSGFLGYTAMPDRKFGMEHAKLTMEELAVRAIPQSVDVWGTEAAKGTSLYPQMSTFNQLKRPQYPYPSGYYVYNETTGDSTYIGYSNCPAPGTNPSLCLNEYPTSGSMCEYPIQDTPTDSPSVNDSFGYLVALTAIYSVLAAYWALVLPQGNGAPRKAWFFLLPSYWCGVKAEDESDDEENNDDEEGGKVLASGRRDNRSGVVAKEARKCYGDFEAVKSVSLRMERGELTALLGHNGAGKTTLSKLISCDLIPTSGDVSVFGNSVVKTPDAVRQLVGVCQQDDYLWPNLSAKEHLTLFAGLRGVPQTEIPEIVQKWLESVDLANVQDHYASSYSGGMKRRLSVSLATVGDRPLIILDEPTTGMDPVSRRFVWRHIDEVKAGRVVLLTTHAMEEADLLADNVAIMKKGSVAARGTPLELKAQHGSALQFSILVDKDKVNDIAAAIRERFKEDEEWVGITVGDTGNISVNIRSIKHRHEKNDDTKEEGEEDENEEDGGEDEGQGVDVEKLADFVGWLETDESGISEYGFSNSSLEEVFLAVTEDDDDEDDDYDDDMDVDVCCACCCPCCIKCCLKGRCRACCRPKPRVKEPHEGVTPEASTIGGQDEQNKSAAGDIEGAVIDVNEAAATNDIAGFKPKITMRSQLQALMRHLLTKNWRGKTSISNYCIYCSCVIVAFFVGFSLAGNNDPFTGMIVAVILLSLMLCSLVTPIYSDRGLGLFYLMRTQGLMPKSYLIGQGSYGFFVVLVYAFVLMSLFYASSVFREPKIADSWNVCNSRGFFDPPCRVTYDTYQFTVDGITYQDIDGNTQLVKYYATYSGGNYGQILGSAVFFAFTIPGAMLTSSFIPGYRLPIILVGIGVLGASIFPMLFSLQSLTQEEQKDCVDNVFSGAYDFCNDATWSTSKLNESSENTEKFLNCAGIGSVGSNKSQLFCLPSYAGMFPQIGLFETLIFTLMRNIKFQSEPYGDSYVDTLQSSLKGAKCKGNWCRFPHAKSQYGEFLGYMLLGAVCLFILGVMVAFTFGFPIPLVLRMKQRMKELFCSFRLKQNDQSERTDSSSPDADKENGETELGEVAEERKEVEGMMTPLLSDSGTLLPLDDTQREEVPPVLMHKLRKVYPSLGGLPPKVALKSLDLHVPKGQVLGLLGKNGAGKTTALKILSCAHDSSDGIALIAGYDVSAQQLAVFERLGSCAQFDVIWSALSVRLHLEFFAQLKGLPKSDVKDAAHAIATAVGLGSPEVYERHAGGLSGGMRRRLSIAISLIGAPHVLLLDEPSTGLDPSTRNSIWHLVGSFATESRAIIITTHMMIEADTLCNRIAIMSRGELRVVATQQHLKSQYGSGYLLQLNLVKNTKEDQDKAMSFVRTHVHAEAVLDAKQAKTLHIHLPRELDLKRVFVALYSTEAASEGCINQFLLSQSSLEDVFIALGD